MNKINILINLSKQSNRNQEFMSMGKERGYSKERVKVSDLIEKSLSREIRNSKFKLLNTNDKVVNILRMLEDDKNVLYAHVINKRTVGKNYKKFVNVDNQDQYMRNLSLVFRLNDDDKFFFKNSLVFEVDITKNNDNVAFELNNIFTMNLPENEHKIVDGMVSIGQNFKFELKDHSANNMDWLISLKKPIDLFDSDSNLRIGDWKALTKRIDEFNDFRKGISMQIFGNEGDIKIDGRNKVELLAVIPMDEKLDLKKRYFINNDNENNLRCNVNINKIEEKFIDIQKDKINSNIKFWTQKMESNLNRIESVQISINEKLNEKSVFQEKEVTPRVALEEKQQELNELLSQLNLLKTNKKNAKKNNKDKIKVLNDIFTKKKEEKKELERKHSEINKKIEIIVLNIKKLSVEISSLNKDNTSLKVNIQKSESALSRILVFSTTFKIMSISGTAKIDSKRRNVIIINKLDESDFIVSIDDLSKLSDWSISDYDRGTAAIFKRYCRAMQNLSAGVYKSPYLAISLNNPNIAIKITDPSKYPNLNGKQQIAFQMINNSYQSSFLQGPPGTGKTQVISATISHKVQNNEITLISSSTNEAINNALDRINKDQYNNPNIIFSRISNDPVQREKAKQYLENVIPFNFIDKMIKFGKGEAPDASKSYITAKEILLKYQKADINSYLPNIWFDEIFTEENVVKNIPFFKKFLNLSSYNDDDEYFYSDNKSSINKIKRKMDVRKATLNPKMIEKIDWIYKNNLEILKDKDNFTTSTYDFISKFYVDESKKGNIFDKLLKILSNEIQVEGKISPTLYKQIILDVEKNDLVNVLGITTTSRQEITINGVKKEIFIDYPVDFAIIDEVSKSTTPEIIQISSLASKFLYAGDYRQLPPTMDLAESFFEEFWEWNIKNNTNKFFNSMMENNSITDAEILQTFTESLYKSTLFKNHVIKLKSDTKKNSYTSLNRQYRFTEDISSLVNIVYDDNEKLITNFSDDDFNSYQTDLHDAESKKSVQILDTSKISENFVDFCNNNNSQYIPNYLDDSFDQKRSILFKNRIYSSRINEYNAYEGVMLLIRLKNLNDKLFNPNEVGYICMTRSQADIMQGIIANKFQNEPWLKKIKIDTVDNFQGREKDIVIVDLVRAEGNLGENYKVKSVKRNLEFYSSNERLNVAVSRAKSKLILLGAIENHLSKEVISKILKNNSETPLKIFQEFFDLVNEKGYIKRIWEK